MSTTDDEPSFPPGVDHVIVSSSYSTSNTYHRPDPEEPDEPACEASFHQSQSEWKRKTHARHVLMYDRCEGCSWPDDQEVDSEVTVGE